MSIDGKQLPESLISALKPEGFIAYKTANYIKTWGLHAIEDNPEIIESLHRCNHGGDATRSPYEGAFLEAACFWGMHLIGLSFCYRMYKTREIYEAGEEIVNLIAKERGQDGYLGSFPPEKRMGGNKLGYEENWDIWGQYLGASGMFYWYKATGNALAKQIALEAADNCIRHFEDRTYAVGFKTVSFSVGHIYALLYQETKDEKYLKECMRLLEKEWPQTMDWFNGVKAGNEFHQVGDKRWEALHGIMMLGVLWEETGNQEYYDVIEKIWWSIVKTDRHNNGAFSTKECAIGTPYEPGAIETCCSIAWIAYSLEYLRYCKNSYVADEIELTYYNTILGSLSPNLREVAYDNPMEGFFVKSQVPLAFCYNGAAPDVNCCQANSCRGVGEVVRWAAMTDERSLYLNYYSPCSLDSVTPGKQKINLYVQGDYPASGRVTVTVRGLEKKEKFSLQMRIPCWSHETKGRLNGEALSDLKAGQYYPIEKEWENGDTIVLDLDMQVHFWAGEDRFKGRTSIYYGPILMVHDMDYTHHKILPRTVFSVEALRNAHVKKGDGRNQWVIAEVRDESGEMMQLIDYASAGKTGAFFSSWLRVTPAPVPVSFSHDGMPVWLNKG
ncbi:MAG: glycoside hydrolase family 127 protein [Clostridia bacterium]|nr:glycoside hydrolase family 127 protein [Clostridia bacterium]